jgi:uncharacterized protein (TIGR03435 family)
MSAAVLPALERECIPALEDSSMSEASLLKQVVNLGSFFALAIVCSLSSDPAIAQQSGSPPQSSVASQATNQPVSFDFEVATIKPSSEQGEMGVKVYPGGRIQINDLSLKALVAAAFNLSFWQISGGDDWTGKEHYDLGAKPPEELRAKFTNVRHSLFTIDDPRLRGMLQSLLIDRFQLKFHRETKTGDVYLLEQSGKPIRLKPAIDRSTGDDASMPAGFSGDIGFVDGRFSLYNTSMPQFARFASTYVLHKPVIDHTGITGSYDYASPTQYDQDDFGGSFMQLIPELGLKLERGKGPVETFVIDHAEKPSPN